MPRGVGRPEKEGKKPRVKNPRGAPRKNKPVLPEAIAASTKQEVKVENHAKFGMEEPCRVILHFQGGDFDEVMCKSYSLSHGICYLTTKTGEQLVPLAQIRKVEVVRM